MSSESGSPSNRRLSARLACQLTVHYRLDKPWHPATALNLSSLGCRLRLGEDLPRGATVELSFEAPLRDGAKALSLEIAGKVIWSRHEGLSHQAGIQFSGEPPDELDEVLNALG
jgi:hypothetical protein